MKKLTKKWFAYAEVDLKAAEVLFKNKSYQTCIYHCHQVIEKVLKGIISERGERIPKVHDLPQLLEESGAKFSDSILEFIEELNPYYNPIRYPDTAVDFPLKYDRKIANRILKLTKNVSKWLKLNQKE